MIPPKKGRRLYLALAVVLALSGTGASGQEKVIPLYEGPAPGSEKWTQQEKEFRSELLQARVVINVVTPTLTVFQPEPAQAVGTGVIICPGGGFHLLSIDSEGFEVARWLATKGVTSFVLKYRLVECKTGEPFTEMMQNFQNFEKAVAPTVELAAADGLAAVDYVRRHAAEYGLKTDRIGIIGFSAGGSVAASVGYRYAEPTRPNFVAPIYPAWQNNKRPVPTDAPPMFILAATDDQLGLAPDSVALYQDWVAAKKPAELHLYARGGHGFGMRKQDLPSDAWIERFADWLGALGLLKK